MSGGSGGATWTVRRSFAEHGRDINEERYAQLADTVGPDYDRELSHRRRTAYRSALHATLQPRPGITEWVTNASARGVRLAVASSSPTHWVTSHLDRAGLRDRFAVIAGGEEVAEHKPDPAVYLLALQRLGVDPGGAMAVEDTPHGVDAAQRAGLRCVAIPNPFVDPARVRHADLVLSSAADLSWQRCDRAYS